MSRTKLKGTRLPNTVTQRGTVFGGLLDCFVLNGPDAISVFVHGRVASLVQRSVVDILFARTTPVHFLHEGKRLEGRGDNEMCDALIDLFRGDSELTPEQRKVVSAMVRVIIKAAAGKLGALPGWNELFES